MAFPVDTSSLDDAEVEAICNMCTLKPGRTVYTPNPKPVVCLAADESEDEVLHVPLAMWSELLDEVPTTKHPKAIFRCDKDPFTLETDPKGTRDQDAVVKEALTRLKTDRVCFLACFPGFGKTFLSSYISSKLGLKTVVLCHLDKIRRQWVDEFKNHTSANVQLVASGVAIDPEADVYVIGVLAAANRTREEFAQIGLVVFDEAHIALPTAVSKTMLKFHPRYVLGLSATPTRSDGLQKLLYLYFGKKENFIVRQEVKNFTVIKLETHFVPTVRYRSVHGKTIVDNATLINSIAYSLPRQKLIVHLVRKHPDRRIIVLSGRQEECQSIFSMLEKFGESVILLTGSKKIPDTTKYRVLVAGFKKAGVGFDDPGLTMGILATNVTKAGPLAQLEGRVRTNDCIFYDIVDDYNGFHRNWVEVRKKWWEKRGATIKYRKTLFTKEGRLKIVESETDSSVQVRIRLNRRDFEDAPRMIPSKP